MNNVWLATVGAVAPLGHPDCDRDPVQDNLRDRLDAACQREDRAVVHAVIDAADLLAAVRRIAQHGARVN